MKINLSSFGAPILKNQIEVNEDTVEQMMKGEFLEKNEIRFLKFLYFVQTHFENLLNESQSIIKLLMDKVQFLEGQLKEIPKDSNNLEANRNKKKSNKKEDNIDGEIIKQVNDFFYPQKLFNEIYQVLDSKGASKIIIKALTNCYYLDLREIELHEPKVDIKFVIEVLKMNHIFTCFLVNQYDQVRLIY